MVTCSIKMIYKKNKKALGINTEFLVAIIAIIFIVLVVFFTYKVSMNTKEQYHKVAPELSYQFPAVFVHSFLMMKVDDKYIEELGLDKDQVYFVKDLLILKRDDVKSVIDEIKKEYVSRYAYTYEGEYAPLYFFERFSGNKIKPEHLLCIYYDTQSFSLKANVVRDNYYFYMKTIEGDKVYVRFNCGGSYK